MKTSIYKKFLLLTLACGSLTVASCSGSGSAGDNAAGGGGASGETYQQKLTDTHNCIQVLNSDSNTPAAWYTHADFTLQNTCNKPVSLNNLEIEIYNVDPSVTAPVSNLTIVSAQPWNQDFLNVVTAAAQHLSSAADTDYPSAVLMTLNTDQQIGANASINVAAAVNNQPNSVRYFVTNAATGSLAVNPIAIPDGFTIPDAITPHLLLTKGGDITVKPITLGGSQGQTIGMSVADYSNLKIDTLFIDETLGNVYGYIVTPDHLSIANHETATINVAAQDGTKAAIAQQIKIDGLDATDQVTVVIDGTNADNSIQYVFKAPALLSASNNTATYLFSNKTDQININFMVTTQDKTKHKYINSINFHPDDQAVIELQVKNVSTTQIISPYKDIAFHTVWQSDTATGSGYTAIGSYIANNVSLTSALPLATIFSQGSAQFKNSNHDLTLAFATGSCTAPNWQGVDMIRSLQAIRQADSQFRYIISTGGAAGTFSCDSGANLAQFVENYSSNQLIGLDFDIEQGSGEQYAPLINSVAQLLENPKYSNFRVSFTIATLGADGTKTKINDLNALGASIMDQLTAKGLLKNPNVYINLMTMDYGSNTSTVCTLKDGHCDMVQSAINAAKTLNAIYNVPMDRIELTPMIGVNDTQDEITTLDDVTTMKNYVLNNGLGGLHMWSFDRDTPVCTAGNPSCSGLTEAQASTGAFWNALLD